MVIRVYQNSVFSRHTVFLPIWAFLLVSMYKILESITNYKVMLIIANFNGNTKKVGPEVSILFEFTCSYMKETMVR